MATPKVTVHVCADCGCEVEFDTGYCAACDSFPAIVTVLADDDQQQASNSSKEEQVLP